MGNKSMNGQALQIEDTINFYRKSHFQQRSREKALLKNVLYDDYSPAFTLNPLVIAKLQSNQKNYILFIDARINTCYLKVKNFLEANKNKLSSYCCTGDADFIIEYSASPTVHDRFVKEIYDLLEKAPINEKEDPLVQSFSVSKQNILKRETNPYSDRMAFELNEEEIQFIHQIQSNYISKQSKEALGGERKLKTFLAELQRKQILLGYYPLGKPKAIIRVYVLILYALPGYDEFIFRTDEIKKYIVDFSEVNIVGTSDPFYRKANYIITAEFLDVSGYHQWKEKTYQLSADNGHHVNVMTFFVEETISERPVSIGNLSLFDEVAKTYDQGINNRIMLGHPYYNNEPKENYKICLRLESLKENGLILGEPGTGKTYTAAVLTHKLYEKGIRVHIIDCSGGIIGKYKEVFNNSDIDNHIESIKINDAFDVGKTLGIEHKIYIYEPDQNSYANFVSGIMDYIIGLKNEEKNRKTTDVVFFEEAHLFLKNKDTSSKISSGVTICGRKGFSLWFSTQKFSHFPLNTIIPNLRNRIFHRLDINEATNIIDMNLLPGNVSDTLYNDLNDDLTKLKKGQAIVSFISSDGQSDQELLRPLKVKIVK